MYLSNVGLLSIMKKVFIVFFAVYSIGVMAEPIKINPVSYDSEAKIRRAVKKECNMPEKLTKFIEKYSSTYNVSVIRNSNRDQKGKQLSIKITQVIGGGGGMYSGMKAVKIEGRLTKNGKLIGSFTGSRMTGGGFMGGFKGTCSLLGRCVKALGRDVAEWLQAPSINDVLGDDSLNY